MTTIIILLLICIIISICKNDYSLIIGIGKIIIYGALIICVLCIIAYATWLLFIVLIGGVIYFIYHRHNNSVKYNVEETKYDEDNPNLPQKPQIPKLSFGQWFFILIWAALGLLFFAITVENMGSLSIVYLVICGGISAILYYAIVIQDYNKAIEEYNKKVEYIKFIDKSDKTIFDVDIKIDNTYNSSNYNENELSDFQKELRNNTKTPQQVINEKIIQEKEYILKTVIDDYNCIKNKLNKNVKNGIYYTIESLRCTSIDFESKYLLSCIDRKYSDCPTGSIGHSNYRKNSQLEYRILKKEQYKFYLKMLKEHANADNIDISEYFVSIKPSTQEQHKIILPYIYRSEHNILHHKIKVYLKCSIKY